MIIGIDGNEANVKNRVGVNNYAYELLKEFYRLHKIGENNNKYIIYLEKPPLADLPKEEEWFKYEILNGKKFWVLTKLMPHLLWNKRRIDVLFTPSHYLPIFSKAPMVCSIMDLGYLEFSEQFKKLTFWQLKYWTAMSLIISKRIITISNSTKRDIVRHYPFTHEKVRVTYLAYDKKRFKSDIKNTDVRRVMKKYKINTDYLLTLSTLKPSKNIEGIVYAFKGVSRHFNRMKLVVAGKKGWLFESIYQKVSDLKLKDKVIFTDFIDEEDKPGLIKGAKLLISPSFWEGFGLHVLESMACGTPVVVSNTGSLPEIVGEVGILVDPNDVDSIKSGILKVLDMNKDAYNKLVRNSLLQANKFSWEETARKTLKILEEVKS